MNEKDTLTKDEGIYTYVMHFCSECLCDNKKYAVMTLKNKLNRTTVTGN